VHLLHAGQGWSGVPNELVFRGFILARRMPQDCCMCAVGMTSVTAMQTLRRELNKVDRHYEEREAQLQTEILVLEQSGSSEALETLVLVRKSIQELTNFAALNYSAVLKIVKKRNRRLQIVCGDSVVTAPSFDFLKGRAFFTSTRLAILIGSAHALTQVR
jgi:hypothetical protein